MYSQSSIGVCLLCFLSLSAVRGAVSTDVTWQETEFQTGWQPQTVTVSPSTVLYRCGFKSSDKLKYNITSDIPLYAYSVDKKYLQDLKIKGNHMSFKFERRSVCVNRTICEKSSRGRIIKFDKCFVLNNALGLTPGTAVVQLRSKWDDKTLVVFVLLGAVVVGFFLVITCIICRIFQCMACDCCAQCWYYHGKAKRKGYSPYTAPV